MTEPKTHQALTTQVTQMNPAVAYLSRLNAKRSRQTMRSTLNLTAKILDFKSLSDCPWSALRRAHIQAVLRVLQDAGKAPATQNLYLSALKGVCFESWTLGLITTTEHQHIQSIRAKRAARLPKGRSLASAEITQLLAVCTADTTAKGLRDTAIISLLIGCGLRRSEVVALQCQDINHSEQSIKVLGKGNHERMAFLPVGTWQKLQQWLNLIRGDTPGPLFTRIRRFDDVTTAALSSQAIYYVLEQRRREAHLDAFAPHDLRRSFASNLLAQGEDLLTVKDAMGHAQVTTTQRYDHRGHERLKQAREKIKA